MVVLFLDFQEMGNVNSQLYKELIYNGVKCTLPIADAERLQTFMVQIVIVCNF